MLTRHTIADIRALRPCYDPTRYLPEDWTGTALDVLRVEACPAEDRLWVVLREGWVPDAILHAFACDCAERALQREREAGREPDARSWRAIQMKRRWLQGEASDEELAAAYAAGYDAGRDATHAAACAIVWDAARAAAWDAERDAVWAAARAVARDAVYAAAWAAARAGEREWQAAHLVELLGAEPPDSAERRWQC